MIEIDSKAAKNHPDLKRFTDAMKELAGGKMLHFDQIGDDKLVPFQDNLIISRRMGGGEDFAFEYWGDGNTRVYGHDLTGKSILTANFGHLSNLFMSVDCQVITTQKNVYLNGVFDWLDEDHKVWYRVAMPLNGVEGVERVISYTSFFKMEAPGV